VAEGTDRFDGSVAGDFAVVVKCSIAACGVSIATDGMPGELTAYGVVYHSSSDEGYFSAITFSDPKVLRSAGFVYPGVPIGPTSLLPDGTYGARLILANFGAKTSQVTVRYSTTNKRKTQAKTLAIIPANSTKVTEFTDLTGEKNPNLRLHDRSCQSAEGFRPLGLMNCSPVSVLRIISD
jgi:hypothetical protein